MHKPSQFTTKKDCISPFNLELQKRLTTVTMKQNMFLIKEKPHNVVEKPTHRAGNKMWENWMEKEMEIFPNFILEKKQKSTIFEFIINPKNGQPILEHDKTDR